MNRWTRGLGAFLFLLLVSLGEHGLLERLLLRNRDEVEFVWLNVTGILTGTPVWKSSQHRLLGPLLLSALARVTQDPLGALQCFTALGLLAENLAGASSAAARER